MTHKTWLQKLKHVKTVGAPRVRESGRALTDKEIKQYLERNYAEAYVAPEYVKC